MHPKSCHSHDATAKQGCQQHCSQPAAKEQSGKVIIWIVAVDRNTAHLFVQYPGKKIEPLSMGCYCSNQATDKEAAAKYLDKSLACGHYTGLVLVGAEKTLKALKRLLSPAVYNRVIAEIVHDITGMSAREVAQDITARTTI